MSGSQAAAPLAHLGLEIRPFRDTDRAAVIALWRACELIVPQNDPDRDIDFCRASRHGELFVGFTAEALAATAMAGHDGHRGWLYYVATHPAHRRRGIGRRMLAHAEAWLAARGVPKVNLLIRAPNVAAQAFYQRLGYAAEPRLSMGKRFAPAPGGAPPGKLEVVITYLEMTARAPIAAPPPPALKLAVLRADSITLPFYRYLYDIVGGPWLWYERRRMGDDELKAIIRDPKCDIFVLYVGGEPAGYAELDRRFPPDIELAYFGLAPPFFGRRLGPFFLRWAIDAAWSHDPRRLWVHTCNYDHPKAIAIYQRAGFKPYRQETKLVDDPRATP